MVNKDQQEVLERMAQRVVPAGIMSALRETYKTDEVLSYNVSPETCLDVLLFSIREVLNGSGNPH